MTDRITAEQVDSCPRCGASADKILSQRVAGPERGYVQIAQCEECGQISQTECATSIARPQVQFS